MASAAQNDLELRVQRLCQQDRLGEAATEILSALGADVLRALYARFRSEQVAAELFARFAEALWVGLPTFAFRCPLKVWVFTLARNVGNRYLARELRRTRAQVPLSQALDAQVEALRSATLAHLRTENRDRVRALRQSLDEADQLLLNLRVDKALSFREVALVMLADVDAAEHEVTREASRLRKRFQLVKEQLRKRLAELGPDEDTPY
jgi:RNA polymerase sigma-70 factor (ECF subfamily)